MYSSSYDDCLQPFFSVIEAFSEVLEQEDDYSANMCWRDFNCHLNWQKYFNWGIIQFLIVSFSEIQNCRMIQIHVIFMEFYAELELSMISKLILKVSLFDHWVHLLLLINFKFISVILLFFTLIKLFYHLFLSAVFWILLLYWSQEKEKLLILH
jgi:hypothetical protein